MKKIVLSVILCVVFRIVLFAQAEAQIEGEVVFSNDNVVFHRIDSHTWVGTGNMMYSESLYLLEGKDRAILSDRVTCY